MRNSDFPDKRAHHVESHSIKFYYVAAIFVAKFNHRSAAAEILYFLYNFSNKNLRPLINRQTKHNFNLPG